MLAQSGRVGPNLMMTAWKKHGIQSPGRNFPQYHHHRKHAFRNRLLGVEANPPGVIDRLPTAVQKGFYLNKVPCEKMMKSRKLYGRFPPTLPSVKDASRLSSFLAYPIWAMCAKKAFQEAVKLEANRQKDKRSSAEQERETYKDNPFSFFTSKDPLDGHWFPGDDHEGTKEPIPVSLYFYPKGGAHKSDAYRQEVKRTINAFAYGSPNGVLEPYDVYTRHPTHRILVMPRISFSLSTLINDPDLVQRQYPNLHLKNFMPEWVVRDIFLQVFRTINDLYSAGMAHRDLRPENIVCITAPKTFCSPKFIKFISSKKSSQNIEDAPAILRHRYQAVGGRMKDHLPLKKEHLLRTDVYSAVSIIHELLYAPHRNIPAESEGIEYVHRVWGPKSSVDRPLSATLNELFTRVLIQKNWIANPMSPEELILISAKWEKEELKGMVHGSKLVQ
ncbi:MAG: hypothetical protein DHS80DRAFT_29096 [Piptocephalis tieghemiana]|nr:MAG: hypothetical protein DHS80DRAFT_29096 [Piptocephalis tieghemiana]